MPHHRPPHPIEQQVDAELRPFIVSAIMRRLLHRANGRNGALLEPPDTVSLPATGYTALTYPRAHPEETDEEYWLRIGQFQLENPDIAFLGTPPFSPNIQDDELQVNDERDIEQEDLFHDAADDPRAWVRDLYWTGALTNDFLPAWGTDDSSDESDSITVWVTAYNDDDDGSDSDSGDAHEIDDDSIDPVLWEIQNSSEPRRWIPIDEFARQITLGDDEEYIPAANMLPDGINGEGADNTLSLNCSAPTDDNIAPATSQEDCSDGSFFCIKGCCSSPPSENLTDDAHESPAPTLVPHGILDLVRSHTFLQSLTAQSGAESEPSQLENEINNLREETLRKISLRDQHLDGLEEELIERRRHLAEALYHAELEAGIENYANEEKLLIFAAYERDFELAIEKLEEIRMERDQLQEIQYSCLL